MEDCRFVEGYLEGGGPLVWLRHLIEDVASCEGGPDWSVRSYDNGHISRFQFSVETWRNMARATGYVDGNDPYAVGRNVASLINRIDDPGSTAGWPHCWHQGSIP